MTNSSDERISALMDGELDEQLHHSTADELLNKDEARETWSRYHLISDTLRQQLPNGIDNQFSSRVMAALDDEPTVLAPPAARTSTLTQRLAGLAVAASVAAVAVMGVQFIYQEDGQAPVEQIAKTSTTSLPNTSLANRVPTSQALAQAAARQNIQTVTQSMNPAKPALPAKRFPPNLNKYLVDHNQQTARAAVQGVMPYARIVAQPNVRYIVIPEQK